MASSSVKVYTVNGAAAGSSSSLPDWLVRKRAGQGKKGKRVTREHVEGTIELIQGFEFPEASNKVKSTRDGKSLVATGTYKPQMRVWDLEQLSMKFERHTDAENVDFVMLSDDWNKSVHLQNDRSVELHTQGGTHYRTRIPRFGRSVAYHFPSCDALFSASGNEIYRLNLDQGRFMTPLVLEDNEVDILGVNTIDINSAHQLLAFGIDGSGSVHFLDPRSRSKVGILRVPRNRVMDFGSQDSLSVTALASRSDGLSYAVGTSSGHTFLYDIRAAKPFGMKDQGYGLPVQNLSWIDGGGRMAGDGLVVSADRKVIKIWDRNSPSSNFASITPASDLNHVHHIPGSGLFVTANEGIQMATYYIPQLGPAPRWASFLENITEEMEDSTTRSVYEDFKFVDRDELARLGLDNLVGTPALKPYMHGYFLSLKLYDTARLIANPFVYEEHREKQIQEKMDKMADTRIRAKKEQAGVKVNKALGDKVLREAEREVKRAERKKAREAAVEAGAMDVDEKEDEDEGKTTLLNDPRFSMVFNDPEFQIDETTREYALLNPSSAALKARRGKTAVEEEEEDSDKNSSDGLGGDDDDEESVAESEANSSDSDDAGELNKFDPRARPGQTNALAHEAYERNKREHRAANVPYTAMRAQSSSKSGLGKDASFGQRRTHKNNGPASQPARGGKSGAMEVSWTPSSSAIDGDDSLVPGGRGKPKDDKRRSVETFGAGMERGGGEDSRDVSESERHGRTRRRTGNRSGSKNVFRQLDG